MNYGISVRMKNSKEEDVNKALNMILSQHGDYFSRIWDSLALSQKKLMLAIAQDITVQNPYSTPFIKKYSLISASHVKKALDNLEKETLIHYAGGSYYIEDVFLREWIRVNLCTCAASLSTSVKIKRS